MAKKPQNRDFECLDPKRKIKKHWVSSFYGQTTLLICTKKVPKIDKITKKWRFLSNFGENWVSSFYGEIRKKGKKYPKFRISWVSKSYGKMAKNRPKKAKKVPKIKKTLSKQFLWSNYTIDLHNFTKNTPKWRKNPKNREFECLNPKRKTINIE